MAHTRNPLRYSPQFFEWIRAIESGTFTTLHLTLDSIKECKALQHKLAGFRWALKMSSEDPKSPTDIRNRYERLYVLALSLTTRITPEGQSLEPFSPNLAQSPTITILAPAVFRATANPAQPLGLKPDLIIFDDHIDGANPSKTEFDPALDLARFLASEREALTRKIRTQLITMMEFALNPDCPTPEENPIDCVAWLVLNHPSWTTSIAIQTHLQALLEKKDKKA